MKAAAKKVLPVLALCALVLAFTGCGSAIQPFARFDRDGYALGVGGTWKGVAKEVRRATQAEDFKEVR